MRVVFIGLLVAAITLSSASAATVANDPKSIILDLYAKMRQSETYDPPRSVFTPHLAALITGDEKDAKGEVGRLDVDIWVNGQDYKLGKVTATAVTDDFRSDRQVVTATVMDFGKPEVVKFYFEKLGGKWLIDDLRWTGKDGWTLSLVVKYGDAGD